MKLLVVLLIVIILLFVVLVVWGAGRSGSDDSKHPEAQAQQFNKDRKWGGHASLESFNRIFGRFSPTLKPSALNPSNSTFDLQTKAYSLVVLRDEDHDFRQAKFQVIPMPAANQPLCADVVYNTLNNEGSDQHLNHQDSSDIDNKDPANEFTLTILKGGGILEIKRHEFLPAYTGPCKVILK